MQNIIAMNPEEFKKRAKAFAVRIINLVDRLPNSQSAAPINREHATKVGVRNPR